MWEIPVQLLRPFLGARVLKTGLAVFSAIVIFYWIEPRFAVIAGIPAFLAVQPSVVKSGRAIWEQFVGNVAGAVIGTVLGIFLGPHAWTMALGVVIAIVLLPRIGLMEGVTLSVVMVLVVLDQPEHGFLQYSLLRIGSVVGGTLIGYLINRFVLPPDFAKPTRTAILEAADLVDRFAEHLMESLAYPEHYQKEQIKAENAALHAKLDTARQFLRLMEESNREPAQRLLINKKGINGLFVFTERITDIHKIALQMGGLTTTIHREAISQALEAVVAFKVAVYQQALRGEPAVEGAGARALHAVEQLDTLVHHLIDDPADRLQGLHMHSILVNIRHMLWRVQSVERLVA